MTDEGSAFAIADLQYPGKFGVFYEKDDVPTKNHMEQKWVEESRAKVKDADTASLLEKRFSLMR